MENPAPDTRLPGLSRAATPIAFIEAILTGYRRYGADPANALARAGISPALLGHPEARVTASQMEIMSGAAMQELDDEALGWFSRRLPWGSYGMLCRASITSPNLGVALKRWCRHHGLLTSDIALRLGITGSVASITVEERGDLGLQREFSLVHVLRNIHGLACWYVDSRIALLGARFPFPAPPHADAYPLLFPAPLKFDAAQAELRLDAEYLDLPIRRDERAMRQMLQRALPLTVLQYRRDRLLVQQVRQTLLHHPEASHNADTVAARLNISARTLHRQLRDEESSLQQLKDEVRQLRATDLLVRTDRPVKQVAAAVGFRNEKSFSRAFRAWTGQAPAEFRRAQGSAADAGGGA
mgnify:CR=1 FL=1